MPLKSRLNVRLGVAPVPVRLILTEVVGGTHEVAGGVEGQGAGADGGLGEGIGGGAVGGGGVELPGGAGGRRG